MRPRRDITLLGGPWDGLVVTVADGLDHLQLGLPTHDPQFDPAPRAPVYPSPTTYLYERQEDPATFRYRGQIR